MKSAADLSDRSDTDFERCSSCRGRADKKWGFSYTRYGKHAELAGFINEEIAAIEMRNGCPVQINHGTVCCRQAFKIKLHRDGRSNGSLKDKNK